MENYPMEKNEYGLYDNMPSELSVDLLKPYGSLYLGIKNLGLFLWHRCNDGAFDDIDEAESEVLNIMRGEFNVDPPV
jgi:hypothetical protein